MSKRLHQFDNLKILLIFLVVMGHLLELMPGQKADAIYRMIYSFHMPLFIFVTGYFAKAASKNIWKHLVWPYLLFQTIYLIFDAVILKNETVSLQYTKPYWLLWYLLVVIMYRILLPALDSEKLRVQVIEIVAAMMCAILAGFDDKIGYFLSLSRFFTFFPFFLLGYYCKKNGWIQKIREQSLYRRLCTGISVMIVIIGIFYVTMGPVTSKMLYGSYAYAAADYNPWIKSMLMLIALGWSGFLLMTIPNKKIPVISNMGTYTFPVFLLHGFVVRLLNHYDFFHYSQITNGLLAVVFAMGILCAFGNRWVGKAFELINS